jgi:hypothetical protein
VHDPLADGIASGLNLFYEDQKIAFSDANNERVATVWQKWFLFFFCSSVLLAFLLACFVACLFICLFLLSFSFSPLGGEKIVP